MASCPECGRPAAIAGSRCLYCGGALPEAAPARAPEESREPGRCLVVVDLEGVKAETLSRTLSLNRFTAQQRARRGGFHLLQVSPEAEGQERAARLRDEGLTVLLIPEQEVLERARPIQAVRGSPRGGALQLRGPEGALSVEGADPFLLVRGEIARARQASLEWKKAGRPLDPSLRIHIHRRSDRRPVEIDPFDFECGATPVHGSVLLEINGWLTDLFGAIGEDTSFRHEHPALAPSAPGASGVSGMAQALQKEARRSSKKEAVLLDNLGQFRFYSAWQGAVLSRREAG